MPSKDELFYGAEPIDTPPLSGDKAAAKDKKNGKKGGSDGGSGGGDNGGNIDVMDLNDL